MTLRQLLAELEAKSMNGTNMDSELLVRVGREFRTVTSTYTDGTFILVAGLPVNP